MPHCPRCGKPLHNLMPCRWCGVGVCSEVCRGKHEAGCPRAPRVIDYRAESALGVPPPPPRESAPPAPQGVNNPGVLALAVSAVVCLFCCGGVALFLPPGASRSTSAPAPARGEDAGRRAAPDVVGEAEPREAAAVRKWLRDNLPEPALTSHRVVAWEDREEDRAAGRVVLTVRWEAEGGRSVSRGVFTFQDGRLVGRPAVHAVPTRRP